MTVRALLAAGAAACALLAAAPAAVPQTAPAPCRPAALRASFRYVPGSGAAGHVTYALRLTNRRRARCTVSGRPGLRLLDRRGRALPTHVVPDRIGTGTAALITLARGRSALADGRFSPDVPGPGEQHPGPCERTAVRVRVTLASPGRGSLTGRVSPATPVCEHGRIVLSLLRAAR